MRFFLLSALLLGTSGLLACGQTGTGGGREESTRNVDEEAQGGAARAGHAAEKQRSEVVPEPTETPEEPSTVEASETASVDEGATGGDATELDPSMATETAPDEFDVELDTTKGTVRIHITRAWAPNGADRFYNLVKMGFYNDVAFFRVIDGFMAQVGMHGTPEICASFQEATIEDDPVTQSNRPGYVTFAKTRMPNSRTTQFFINTADNAALDRDGFAPFGRTRDLSVVRSLFSGYGGGPPQGPSQGRIASEGNEYLRQSFPNLDYIRRATVVEE